MTVDEAAKSLGVPVMTLYTQINRKKGVGVMFRKLGGKWHIDGRILSHYKVK